jgi:sigma-B regulation protein RsbU (phosphoserine phosphatase)
MFQHFPIANLAADNSISVTEWRWTIISIGIGAILLSIGLTSTGLFLFRKKTRDRSLLYFGLFVLLYAIREFLRAAPLLSVFAISPTVAEHVARAITFTFGLPLMFLFLDLVQARWRRIFLGFLYLQLVFAAIAIPLDLFGIARRAVDIGNALLVLGSWILLIIFLVFLRPPGRLSRELRVVAIGLAVFGLFVLHAILTGLQLAPGRDVEPAGFLFFVCTLGYFVAHRIFAREESLLAIQKELEIAQQIQTSILPRNVPHIAGIEIVARYLPMSAVAGDFYDFLVLEGNQLGILIADVTGHGVPAALIASMLKVAFAGQIAHAQEPARVLAGLNQSLCGKFEDHFVTAAYLYVDLDTQVLRYAGAGHPPLLFTCHLNGEARPIEQNGLFLGMFPEAEYSSIEIPLRSGDRYLLYTDGLPESKNVTGEEFGIARCTKFLESNPRLSAAQLADELLVEISRWSIRATGPSQDDDMTLVVIDFPATV